MKATGEVMAIDRSFEAALQKAVRSMEAPGDNLLWEDNRWADNFDSSESHTLPLHANDLRIWALMAALRRDGDLDG